MYAVNWKKSMLKYRTMDSTADHNCLIKKTFAMELGPCLIQKVLVVLVYMVSTFLRGTVFAYVLFFPREVLCL